MHTHSRSVRVSIFILTLSLEIGCAGQFVESPTARTRNLAAHNEGSSHKGKEQIGHYDHQHDADEAMTLGQCQICFGDVTDKEIVENKAYACSENHCVDTHCLSHQVKSLEIHNLPLWQERCRT
jgi:hypothetical protein